MHLYPRSVCTWTNKLIGDEQLPPDLKYQRFLSEIPEWLDGKSERPSKRETFAILRFYQSNDKLIESGLIGPVVIEPSVLRELN